MGVQAGGDPSLLPCSPPGGGLPSGPSAQAVQELEERVGLSRQDPSSSPPPEPRTLIPVDRSPPALRPTHPVAQAQGTPQVWLQQDPHSSHRLGCSTPHPATGFGGPSVTLGLTGSKAWGSQHRALKPLKPGPYLGPLPGPPACLRVTHGGHRGGGMACPSPTSPQPPALRASVPRLLAMPPQPMGRAGLCPGGLGPRDLTPWACSTGCRPGPGSRGCLGRRQRTCAQCPPSCWKRPKRLGNRPPADPTSTETRLAGQGGGGSVWGGRAEVWLGAGHRPHLPRWEGAQSDHDLLSWSPLLARKGGASQLCLEKVKTAMSAGLRGEAPEPSR